MGASAFAQYRPEIQKLHLYGQEDLNIFERLKSNTVLYDGFQLSIGANFAQQWQDLMQSTDGINPEIGSEFELGPGL